MTTFAEFAAGNKAQFFDFLADDRAIVATSVVADAGLGGSSKFNGILWRVEASGVITELTRGPKVSGEYVPIVGVAVGPSTAVVTSAKGTQHKVNFGPVAFDAATQSECGLTVTWRQLTWPEAEAKIGQLSSPNYSIDPGSGGESWIDNVDVDVAEGDDCGPTPLVGIAQYVDNQPSRAVVHCHDDVCELATHGNYPYSTPDDERDSGLPDNFSDFLTAQIAIAPGSTGAPVFSSPLNNDAKVVDTIDATEAAAASSHNASGGLSIRFRICTDASCTTVFPAEEENPPFTGAGLSVTRLSDDTIPVPLADCIVIDQGASTPDLPVFRTTNPDGVTHNFNLNTPIDGPPACQQSGLFVATVFSHSGKFTKTSILFRLN